jgi:hypothetical protein
MLFQQLWQNYDAGYLIPIYRLDAAKASLDYENAAASEFISILLSFL